METHLSLLIERAAYDEFIQLWYQESLKQQSMGQAFYNLFNLHQLTDQDSMRKLYEADGKKASGLILRPFHLH